MEEQISMDELLAEEKQPEKITIPVSPDDKVVYKIPQDVFENRCKSCCHYKETENIPVPLWALHKQQYSDIIPCRIMAVARMDEMPGECMSFAPRIYTYGICETCKHNNMFAEGFCTKEDHAEQHRVYYGCDYGGDERKKDYYSRHRLSVCDDYEPDFTITLKKKR